MSIQLVNRSQNLRGARLWFAALLPTQHALEGMPPLTPDPDPSEEPFLHRLSQLMDWLLNGDDEPQPEPCKAQTGQACQRTNLGLVASMRFTLQASPLAVERDEWSAKATSAASTPAGIAKALDAVATAGKAVCIVFISANQHGRRWGEDCAAAEAAITAVLRSWLPGGKIELVEVTVPQAQWCRWPTAERNPFLDSEIFGRVQLPLIIDWVDGRAADRLCAPAIADSGQVRAFFERSSAGAAATTAATVCSSTATVRLDTRGATARMSEAKGRSATLSGEGSRHA